MKRIIPVLLLAFLFISGVYAQRNGLSEELINRKWSRTVTIPDDMKVTYFITFKPDSTFHLTDHADHFSVVKKLLFENDKIVFPSSGECGETGNYKFTIEGNNLTFHSEDDECYDRREVLDGVWKTSD